MASFTSSTSALAIVPPAHLHSHINALRSLYDRNFGNWPPHLNILYPFVSPAKLSEKIPRLRVLLEKEIPFELCLESAGIFRMKSTATLWLGPGEENTEHLKTLRKAVMEGNYASPMMQDREYVAPYNPHATIGQTSLDTPAMDGLFTKVEKLAGERLSWTVDRIAVLQRDTTGKMNVVEELFLGGESGSTSDSTTPTQGLTDASRFDPCFAFDGEDWTQSPLNTVNLQDIKEATVLTYNVFHDSASSTARYPLLVSAILAASPTSYTQASPVILCLQEVSDGFLTYLLADVHFRRIYTYSSHGTGSVLPSARNCVVFSTLPFSWQAFELGERHKTAVIGRFPGLVVSNVHLTSSLSDSNIAAKATQMDTLKKQLLAEFPDKKWVVAGDFNLASSSRVIEAAVHEGSISSESAKTLKEGVIDADMFVDCWELAYLPNEEDPIPHQKQGDSTPRYDGEAGATFDRFSNPLAAESAEWSLNPRPQRYDRILIKRSDNTRVLAARRFGFPEDGTCASDHYGVKTVMSMGSSAVYAFEAEKEEVAITEDETDLRELIRKSVPSPEDQNAREEALRVLEICLRGDSTEERDTYGRAVLPIILAPLGSYALDVYSSESDIDCLCVSTISRKTFFQLARQRIRRFSTFQGVSTITILRFADGVVPVLELHVNSIKVDLQYCQAPDLIPRWAEIPFLPASDPLFSLPPASLKTLNAYRDAQFLLRTVPNMKLFRTAHRFLQLWARRSGLYASRFGFLGGVHLTLLLSRVCKLAPRITTAAGLVQTFFRYYANFDWAKKIVFDPSLGPDRGAKYQRLSKEAMVVLSVHTPTVRSNVSQNATKHTVRTLAAELHRANQLLEEQRWEDVLDDGVESFLKSSHSFVKVDIQCWGTSQARSLVGWLESRCPLLLIDLHQSLPTLSARLWPARFCDCEDANQAELRGYYLIGLSNMSTVPLATEDKKIQREKLASVLRTFEHQLQGTDLYDGSSTWFHVSLVTSAETACIDPRDWVSAADEATDTTAIATEEDEDGEITPFTLPKQDGPASIGVKLRPAQDILHRIRWDPELEEADFVIGYEDRFVGTKEIPVSRWKTEQTDLEFIPLHRVAYFRRRNDGTVVWSREGKIDLFSRI